jgi:hypothetical protein
MERPKGVIQRTGCAARKSYIEDGKVAWGTDVCQLNRQGIALGVLGICHFRDKIL